MHTRAYEITNERCLNPLDPELFDDSWDKDQVCRWIDVRDFHVGQFEELLNRLNIDLPRRIKEAVCDAPDQVQVVPTEKVLFASMPVYGRAGIPTILTTVCASTTIITIQHEPDGLLDALAEDSRSDSCLPSASPVGVLFRAMHVGLRRIVPWMTKLRADVASLAQNLGSESGASEKFVELKNRIYEMELVLEDQSYCLGEIEEHQSETLQLQDVRRLIKEQRQDIRQALAAFGRMRERIGELFEHHQHAAEETTNRRLKTLTVLSAVYLPATLIAGIYGMNFESIPVVGIKHGYLIVMLIMIAVVLGQLWYFYRRGWFK